MSANCKMVVNEDVLKRLCNEYKYEIGAGIADGLPRIKVRYVIDTNKFGYAYFGDFFFCDNDFYVWETDEAWKEDHNQDVVEAVFEDECEGRGYAHFQGRGQFASQYRQGYRKDSLREQSVWLCFS